MLTLNISINHGKLVLFLIPIYKLTVYKAKSFFPLNILYF